MTQGWKDPNGDNSIQAYRGVPSEPEKPNNWTKFLIWFCPWLTKKRELGDEYLEAEVRSKQADAMLKESEAILNIAQAEKVAAETAEIAARKEREKLIQVIDLKGIKSAEEIQEELLVKLEEKLSKLKLHYGGKILSVEKNKKVEPSD